MTLKLPGLLFLVSLLNLKCSVQILYANFNLIKSHTSKKHCMCLSKSRWRSHFNLILILSGLNGNFCPKYITSERLYSLAFYFSEARALVEVLSLHSHSEVCENWKSVSMTVSGSNRPAYQLSIRNLRHLSNTFKVKLTTKIVDRRWSYKICVPIETLKNITGIDL